MNEVVTRSRSDRRVVTLALAVVAAVGLAMAWPSAQVPATQAPAAAPAAKKVLAVDDYTRWRSISGQEISGDGNWVTYGLQLTNTPPTETKPVLHLLNLANDQDIEVPNGSGGRFSADSRWIAYLVDPSGGRGGRGGRGATGDPTPGVTETPAPGGQGATDRARRGGDTDTAAARGTSQPRHRRDPVLAGHRVVHVLGQLRRPVPSPPARHGRRPRGGRRGGGRRTRCAWQRAGRGGRGERRPRRPRDPAASTSSSTPSRPGATSCSAASATSPSTRRAICSPTPWMPP